VVWELTVAVIGTEGAQLEVRPKSSVEVWGYRS
jgi:hypothetical protein